MKANFVITKYLFLACIVSIPMIASALPSDANQPIRLLADRATYSERTGVTTYSGKVTIDQATLKIAAANLPVNLDTNNRSIKRLQQGGLPLSNKS